MNLRLHRRQIFGATALLSSGVVSALGLVAILSNRIPLLSSGTAVSLVLFVQWQLMGLTIAKVGIDQVVFACITENPRVRPPVWDYLRSRTIPISLVYGVAMAWVFSPTIAIFCLASIVLDTSSSILTSDLNARERFFDVAVANLLNYPVFFGGVYLFASLGWATQSKLFALFVGSSALRLVWVHHRSRAFRGLPSRPMTPSWSVGLQQALNLALFRADQILLAVTIGGAVLLETTTDEMRHYLYLARYPELVSSVAVTVGPVVLPKLYVSDGRPWREWYRVLADRAPLLAAFIFAVTVPSLIFVRFWAGDGDALSSVPFLVGALLVLPANVLTYSMLRREQLRSLIHCLVLAVFVGLSVVTFAWAHQSLIHLSLLIPVQLATFVTAGLRTRRQVPGLVNV